MKKIFVSLFVMMLFLGIVSPVLAHVTVKPNQVGVGAYQTFTVSVPTEKDVATTGVRVAIPEGLESVRPNVKPGWKIELKKSGTGDDARVTEIVWTAGSIPADQRDEFYFSAKTPAAVTSVMWKAYQTYADGVIVSWDQDPMAEVKDDESSNTGPYSMTEVVNDLATSNDKPAEAAVAESSTNRMTEVVAYIALALSVVSVALGIRKNA